MSAVKTSELARLAQLTDAAFQAAQSQLRAKAAAEARIEAELQHLDAARREVLQTLSLCEGRTPAQITCNAAWLTWAARRRAGLNMALAKARAAALQEKETARRCLGRDQVARALLAERLRG